MSSFIIKKQPTKSCTLLLLTDYSGNFCHKTDSCFQKCISLGQNKCYHSLINSHNRVATHMNTFVVYESVYQKGPIEKFRNLQILGPPWWCQKQYYRSTHSCGHGVSKQISKSWMQFLSLMILTLARGVIWLQLGSTEVIRGRQSFSKDRRDCRKDGHGLRDNNEHTNSLTKVWQPCNDLQICTLGKSLVDNCYLSWNKVQL